MTEHSRRLLEVASLDPALFADMVEQASVAVALKNASAEYVYVNPAFELQFEVNAEDLIGQRVHDWADDVASSQASQQERDVLRTGIPTEGKVTLRMRNGETKNWQVTRFAFKDAHGQKLIAAIAQDVTEQENLIEDLHRAQFEIDRMKVYEQAIDGIGRGSWEGILTYANSQFASYFGSKPDQMVGKSWKDLPKPKDFAAFRGAMARMFKTGRGETEARFVLEDGQERYTWLRLVRESSGSKPGFYIFLRDMTEQRRFELMLDENLKLLHDTQIQLKNREQELMEANRQLEILATTDGLTGLLNHREFQTRLAQQVDLGQRYGAPFSLLLLDIDHFKAYNDSFGHPAGDEVLRRFATVLTKAVRITDLVARYGGEEFTVILPHTTAEGACEFAERIRRAVEAEDWPQRQVTVSIGVASWQQSLDTGPKIVEAADLALYRSKHDGRNRVSVATSREPDL